MMNTSIALEGRPNFTIAMTVSPSPSPSHSGDSSPGTSASTLILVACIALVGVLVTTVVQWWIGRRTIRVNSDTATGIAEQAKADAFAKRYQDAAEQLGHDKAPVRLAGVYAMARLADDWVYQRQAGDWVDQRQPCVDVLRAYLRMPFQHPPDATAVPSDSDDRQELHVRLAAQRILEYHLTVQEYKIPGLPEKPWDRIHIDLEGAVLVNFSFNRCHALYANFRGVQFIGNAQFAEAQFTGLARFDGARFTGDARFDGARFTGDDGFVRAGSVGKNGHSEDAQEAEDDGSVGQALGADFRGTEFRGEAQFDDAQFIGVTEFSEAKFRGDARFPGAQFAGDTEFVKAKFDLGAFFPGARFGGDASFREAKFTGDGALFDDVQFASVWFGGNAFISGSSFTPSSDDQALLDRAQLGEAALFGGEASFRRARFAGVAWFGGVQFTGRARFDDAQFSEKPSFREAQANRADEHVWPPGWRIEPSSSSNSPTGRLISDTTPARTARSGTARPGGQWQEPPEPP